MIALTIHQRIRECRIRAGMTMVELARASGVATWQSVQGWENGTTAPNRTNLPAVAKALGVTESFLAYGPTSPHQKLIEVMLDEHQRTHPHHAHLCQICIEATAALGEVGVPT